MAKKLMKGNEAIAEAAIRAGCRYFFGYPITPQNEVPEYLSRELPKYGGKYVQAESEVAAVNMLYGGASTGKRCMTSSASCGISLKSEGLSYIAAAEVPCVVVDVSRVGPGIGSLAPTQSSYRQATRSGGHGGYRSIVFCPGSVQEAADLMVDAFDIAHKYRVTAYIYADGLIGQVMEPVELPEFVDVDKLPAHDDWALARFKGSTGNRNSVFPDMNGPKYDRFEKEKYPQLEEECQRWYDSGLEDCEYVVTGFGTVGRISKAAVKRYAHDTGKKIGFIRPIIAWPFPNKGFAKIPDTCKKVLVVEANGGQMLEDVERATKYKFPIEFEGTEGSLMPTVEQVYAMLEKHLS